MQRVECTPRTTLPHPPNKTPTAPVCLQHSSPGRCFPAFVATHVALAESRAWGAFHPQPCFA
eukprot:9821300-Alexandrium_andersonii.AAC.1